MLALPETIGRNAAILDMIALMDDPAPVGLRLCVGRRGKCPFGNKSTNLCCSPASLNRTEPTVATPYPFEIVQQPAGQVLMMHELNHQIRVVALDKPLPKFEEVVSYSWFNGHSVGHWEGDTLVVQTRGFNVSTYLDATGAPRTDELVTTERWRKISPTQIEAVVTVHDPQYYTRDWQARFVYALRNDVRIEDYVCGEEHRDISQIKGVEARRAQGQ